MSLPSQKSDSFLPNLRNGAVDPAPFFVANFGNVCYIMTKVSRGGNVFAAAYAR